MYRSEKYIYKQLNKGSWIYKHEAWSRHKRAIKRLKYITIYFVQPKKYVLLFMNVLVAERKKQYNI